MVRANISCPLPEQDGHLPKEDTKGSRLTISSLINSHLVRRSRYRITSRNTPEDQMYRRRPNLSCGGLPKRTEGSSAYTLSERLQPALSNLVDRSQFDSGDRYRQNQAGLRCHQRNDPLQLSQRSWCSVNPHHLTQQLPTILYGSLTQPLNLCLYPSPRHSRSYQHQWFLSLRKIVMLYASGCHESVSR